MELLSCLGFLVNLTKCSAPHTIQTFLRVCLDSDSLGMEDVTMFFAYMFTRRPQHEGTPTKAHVCHPTFIHSWFRLVTLFCLLEILWGSIWALWQARTSTMHIARALCLSSKCSKQMASKWLAFHMLRSVTYAVQCAQPQHIICTYQVFCVWHICDTRAHIRTLATHKMRAKRIMTLSQCVSAMTRNGDNGYMWPLCRGVLIMFTACNVLLLVC
jgi:hypothetical protein